MASTTFYADIQKLYVAYFNRPADVAGLQHWQGVLERTNGDLSIVAKAFAGSQEYTDAYAGKSALATVATVYQNLFGHANDMEGMMWWAERLADGRFTVDFAVTEIAKGAQGSDLVAYNNKVTAATAFTNKLDTIAEITGYDGVEANLRAKAFISKITTDASLETALASLDAEIVTVITPPAPPVPTFTLTASAASVDEGKTVYFTLNSTNTVAGSEYTYSINGIDAADVVGGSLIGTVKLDSTGKAIVAITLAADATTEGIENISMELAGKTASVIVADTSTTPVTAVTYTLTASSTTVDEGGQVTFKLDTTGVAAGTVLSYQLTGIDASRVNGATSGQVTVDANGQALIIVKTVANAFTDGETTMQLALVNGLAAANVGVNDTSLTSTVFTIDSAKIVAANNTNSPIVITTADTGTATVNIASTTSLYARGGIVIEGDADVTVNMGSTNTAASLETVYVTGTGANTVVFSRDSSTSVVLGDGDDTVVVNSMTMVAGQSIDFGAGEDTLDVNGTNNFSTGAITGVEHVAMHSSAVFSAAQLADIQTITELGTDGTLTIAASVAPATLDLTGKLFGEMALVVGANVNVTLGAAELANITSVTTTGAGAMVTTTVAGALALKAISPLAAFAISDTAENLASAPASVFVGAVSISQDGTGTLSIAQAVTVHAAAPDADFTVSATAAELMNALVFEATYETLVSVQAEIVVTGTVSVREAAVFADAGLNTTFVVTDTAQHVADNAAQLDATQISGLALSGTVTAAGADVLVALAVDADVAIAGLNVVDTAGALLNLAPGTIAAATSIRLATGQQLSVADAVELKAEVGAKLVGGYNLIGAANTIVANASIAAGATDIEVTGIVGVAVATQLSKLGNNGSVSFDLTDSPANLASASAAVLANAASVNVQGAVTVAQATAIAGYAVESYTLVDTAANVLGANPTVIAKALANGGIIDVTDASIGAATASALLAIDANAVYAVSDSAAALAALAEADPAAMTSATSVTVTGAGSVEQIAAIRAVVAVTGYSLVDSAEALLDVDAAAVLANAGSVSVTGSVTIAQFEALDALASFDGEYTIVDSADAIANFITVEGADGIAVLNASNAAVVLTDANVSVATATALKSATFTNWSGIYNLVDSVANLIGASVAVRTGAGTVTAEGTVAQINTNFAFINANADGYVLLDSVANLIDSDNAIVVAGADAGVASGVATAAQGAELFALNANVEYDVADTAANLLVAGSKTGVQNATTVTISPVVVIDPITMLPVSVTHPTVAQVKAVVALHAVEAYTVQDTAANLAASAAAGTVAGAAAVVVTTTANISQATAIVAQNDVITLATISDTVAAIQAASADTTTAATNLVVTDGTRLVLSAEEVAHFGQTGGVLTRVTTNVVGASSDDVRFDLVDTFENLAANVALVADAGRITVLAGGDAVDVVAAAALLAALDLKGVSASGFAVTGTAADLLANTAAVEAAGSVVVTDLAISAADAAAILDLNGSAEFSIMSAVADLVLAANAAAVAAATDVTVTGIATVAQINSILGLNADADFAAVAFFDTPAKLAAAPAGMLTGHAITVDGAATVSQFNAINAAADVDPAMSISDTAAAVAAADNDALAAATNVVVTGTATAAQAAALAQVTFGALGLGRVAYNVSDSAAELVLNPSGLDAAGTITVTGTVSAELAVALAAIEADVLTTIDFGNVTVTDTAANLLDLDNAAALAFAANVVVTGTVDVATAAYLDQAIAGNVDYVIVDTVDNLIAAIEQTSGGMGGLFDLNAVLGQADSVTITGNGAIDLFEIAGTWYVTGTIAALKALPAAFLEFGYVVNDSVANIVADFGFAVAGQTAYNITDTGANLVAAATSLISGAADITVTGTVSAADATTIFAANGNASFSIVDSVANLIAAGTLASVSNADAVTATDATSVTNAATLLGRHPDAAFMLSDSAANLIGNLAVTDEATSAAVTGTASVANIAAIKAKTTVTSYNLTDNAAALVAATAGTVSGATAVVVTGTATGAQAKAIYAAKATAQYSILENTTAELFTGNVLNAAVSAAVAVNGTLTVNVAQAQALATLGDKFDGTFAIIDTAAAVAAASQTLLDVATNVTVDGTATAAEATAIAAKTFGAADAHIDVVIVDTAANLLLAANATGIADQDVTVLGTVSVATATSIDTANGTGAIDVTGLSDTSTNLQLGSAAVVNSADTITVTDTQTVAQAVFLENNVGVGAEFTFARITDSLANVLLNLDVALDATVLTVTGTASIAQAKVVAANAALSAKLTTALAVSDTAANILDAYLDQDFKALVTSAPSISITGDVSAQQAVLLQGLGNVVIGTLDIVDTITAINGLSAGLINLSDSVTATVDTDLARQVFSDAGMTTSATIVYANGANLDNGSQIIVTNPGSVYNTTAADILTLKAGDMVDLGAFDLAADAGVVGTLEDGEYIVVRGNVSNGGNTFTYSATGTSTLVMFDADATAGVHMSGVILVGQSGAQVVVGEEAAPSSLIVDVTF